MSSFSKATQPLADTHGIVYTPPPIVDFMSASEVYALRNISANTLSEPGIILLDPCTGTGNFIVTIVRRVSKRSLPDCIRTSCSPTRFSYRLLHCGVEHRTRLLEITKTTTFEGLCFVDTLDIAEAKQAASHSSTKRTRSA